MKATEIDAFISSIVDDLEVTAPCEDASLGYLLTYATPAIDDSNLKQLLHVGVRLRNVADTLVARTADALERAGTAAREKDTVTNLLGKAGLPPAVARRAVKVGGALRLMPKLDATTGDARMSVEHADAVVTGLETISKRVDGGLDADQRDDLESQLLAQASCSTPKEVTTWARKTALELHPEDAPPVAENRDLNDMTLSLGDDGRTHAELDLDVVAAEKLRVALDPLSKPVPEPDGSPDRRSTGQRRADALEEVLDSYLRSEDRPMCGGQLPHVTLTFPKSGCTEHHPTGDVGEGDAAAEPDPGQSSGPLVVDDAVIDTDDNAEGGRAADAATDAATPRCGESASVSGDLGNEAEAPGPTVAERPDESDKPAPATSPLEPVTFAPIPPTLAAPRLEFGQPVSRETAELISCDCQLMAMILNADGVPLDIKQIQRLFPPELRQALIIRDQGCSFPGCGQPPSRCQAHHVVHWGNGGKTVISNGALLCQRHHTVIHHTEWEMWIGADGHPWFLEPARQPGGARRLFCSHARRTLTSAPTAAA